MKLTVMASRRWTSFHQSGSMTLKENCADSMVNVKKAVKEGTSLTSSWILCNVHVMGNAGNIDFLL